MKEAEELDQANGNTLWMNAICKEMDAIHVAFKMLNDSEKIPLGYQEISCPLVFDVKMEDFCWKARYVAGGHTTETPAAMTFASIVSHELARIALTLAALNDLEVKTGDIQNAFLCVPNTEKIWTVCGPEFGPNTGNHDLIVQTYMD